MVAVLLLVTRPVIGASRSTDAAVDRAATVMRHITVAPNERLATWLTESTAATAAGRVVLVPAALGSVYSMRHVSSGLLAQGFAVLVIDPLGMGASDRPADADYTLEAQAERLRIVLDSVGWSDVRIAAHGTSGTIALRLAALAPERITRVVSIAGGPIASQRTDGVRSASRVSLLLNNRIGRSLARRRFAGELRERSGNDAWVNDESLDAYLEPVAKDLRGTLRALQRMGDAIERTEIELVLTRITASVTLLLGEVVTPGSPTAQQVQLLRRTVPHAQVDTVAGSGAMLHEEAPEAVVHALTDPRGSNDSAGIRGKPYVLSDRPPGRLRPNSLFRSDTNDFPQFQYLVARFPPRVCAHADRIVVGLGRGVRRRRPPRRRRRDGGCDGRCVSHCRGRAASD